MSLFFLLPEVSAVWPDQNLANESSEGILCDLLEEGISKLFSGFSGAFGFSSIGND